MKPTVQFIQEKFMEFNSQMFDGRLTMPPIQLSRARTFLGQCAAKKCRTLLHGIRLYDFRLKFSVNFDITEQEWEDVIIHEMIHYYIGVNGLKDTSAHGQLFRHMMLTINQRFCRRITISYRPKPQTPTSK